MRFEPVLEPIKAASGPESSPHTRGSLHECERKFLSLSIHRRVDELLLNLIPRYAFVKSMTESLGGQKESTLRPVLVRFDDLSQMAFEVERGPGDLVTVYLPGSPDPWSGAVAHVTSDRIDVLAGDFSSVVKSLRKVGKGAGALINPVGDQSSEK